jgi:predicted RND superfamily exporter protein
MANQIVLYIGSALTVIWGIAHLFPTKSVVQDFGDISLDNKRIITMEWIIEGISLIFIGVLVCAVTMVDPTSTVSTVVYGISICGLLALALVSLFTGFRINFLPFRLCPFIFTASAVLIFIGGLLQ